MKIVCIDNPSAKDQILSQLGSVWSWPVGNQPFLSRFIEVLYPVNPESVTLIVYPGSAAPDPEMVQSVSLLSGIPVQVIVPDQMEAYSGLIDGVVTDEKLLLLPSGFLPLPGQSTDTLTNGLMASGRAYREKLIGPRIIDHRIDVTVHSWLEGLETLHIHSLTDLMTANRRFLDVEQKSSLYTPVPGMDRTVVGYRCNVDDSATLIAPVLIGHGATIGAGTVVGPFAIIGDFSRVGAGTTASNTVVAPHTSVGSMLRIENSMVYQGGFLDAETGIHVPVTDPFIVQSI